LAEQTGNREVAAQHYGEALRAYTLVLQRPESLGGLRERSDVRCTSLQQGALASISGFFNSFSFGQFCLGLLR
jgi:hypothetical protein